MEEKPNYFSIIPANVRYDNELKPNEKLLYGEISALAQKDGMCWAKNSYFAKLYDVSNETISRWINHLRERGYISVQIIYKEGTMEIENRVIGIDKKINTPCEKNQYPIDEKVKDNNTSNNNIYCPSDDERNIIPHEEKKEDKKTEMSDEQKFEELWKIYPRKEGKHAAFLHYCSWLKGKEYCGKRLKLTPRQMWFAICKYRDYLKENKKEKQFIQMGSTFFNSTIYEFLATEEEIEAHQSP